MALSLLYPSPGFPQSNHVNTLFLSFFLPLAHSPFPLRTLFDYLHYTLLSSTACMGQRGLVSWLGQQQTFPIHHGQRRSEEGEIKRPEEEKFGYKSSKKIAGPSISLSFNAWNCITYCFLHDLMHCGRYVVDRHDYKDFTHAVFSSEMLCVHLLCEQVSHNVLSTPCRSLMGEEKSFLLENDLFIFPLPGE